MKNRLLSILISFMLVVALLPTAVFATEIEVGIDDDLKSKIDSANSGDIIKLTDDVELTDNLTINKTVKLDLNGKTLSTDYTYNEICVDTNGSLTINDNSTDKKAQIASASWTPAW